MTLDPATVLTWLVTAGLRITLIALGALALLHALDMATERLERMMEQPHQSSGLSAALRASRAKTLAALLSRTLRVVIVIVAILMVLVELRFDITPLLASAGILGLAIALASQSFVKDLIGGVFILVEGRFDLGDRVSLGAYTGTVELITMRSTFLRADDGTLIIIPNGTVEAVSNMSRDWRRVVAEFSFPKAEAARSLQVLQAAVGAFQQDPATREAFVRFPGVVEVGPVDPQRVRMRVEARVRPTEQASVAPVFRRRLTEALNAAGVEFTLDPTPSP